MDVVLRVVRQGRECAIFALGTIKGCQLLDFMTMLSHDHPDELSRIRALIERTSDHGIPRNVEKCRFFPQMGLFELKTSGGVRVMAFWDEGRMIVC